MSSIAVLGNHAVSFCTERELDWTLEKMGHRVVQLQENKVSATEVVQKCREANVKLLIYVHTHGWDVQGDLNSMLAQLRASGIKTCSFHLDRFFDLNILDKRDERVGTHPFWKTDKVFTADGGNEEKFRERGVNHIWMPPAVVERDCYFGKQNPKFNCPIAFFGADGYHPEYGFRQRMINRLRERYATNFRVYQGIRQQELNDAYATVKILVGDHCFAGAPKYWSDRLPESLGRGGFLIYPETEGLEVPGLVTYQPQNVDDLISKIDYWLDDDRNQERIRRRNESHEWVKKNATYTQRMQQLLAEMEIK
jgi:hypothetical protein